jgi:hypothetical protein
MAPSSPSSPSPPTAGDAPRATKKRKTTSAPRATPVAERTPSRCSLCSFAASTLDHLLTHVREAHRGTATTCHMGALRCFRSLSLSLAVDASVGTDVGGSGQRWRSTWDRC